MSIYEQPLYYRIAFSFIDRSEGKKIERVQFPLFKGYGRAYEFKRVLIKRKKRGLWEKLKGSFNPKEPEEPQYDISYGPDTFEQEDNEMIEEMNDFEI